MCQLLPETVGQVRWCENRSIAISWRKPSEPGKIEVAAVYLAPGGGPLYIFLRQAEPISDDVGDFFEVKAHEYILREFNAGHSRLPLGRCEGFSGDERKACLNDALGNPSWRHFDPRQSQALPRSKIYEDILIEIGGAEGRRTVPGWASWSQVWPSGASGAGGASGGYDVSDVDTTNIPDPDCESFRGADLPHGRGCNVRFIFFPDLPLAGWENQNNALYVQIKNPPEDETELKALKDRLVPTWKEDGFEFVLIPVNYGFGELWRWSVLLNRFAVSAGNTVGITGAQVTFNHEMYGRPGNRPVVWLNGVQPRQEDVSGSGLDRSTVRTILMIWAVDEDRVAAALPQLLSALNIPVDAVSLVAHDDATPLNVELAIGSGGTVNEGGEGLGEAPIGDVSDDREAVPQSMPVQPSDGGESLANDANVGSGPRSPAPTDVDHRSGQGISMWITVGGALIVGTVILGAALGVSLRLRRRPS